MKNSKAWLILTIIGSIGLVAGIGCIVATFFIPKEELPELEFPRIPSAVRKDAFYSNLTGLETTESGKTAPTYCIQTPNGTDGGRPQAGLDQAGVVFEAIAEAGITRFAAIYQNPTSAVIGPIRSLRLYYLEWDTPFDCTIVHAGGANDALQALKTGSYKDLTENYTYMYRSNMGNRRWNNLFTNATLLAQLSGDRGYTKSEVNGFARMTPDESWHDLIDNSVSEKLVITEPAEGDISEVKPSVSEIKVRFGSSPTFNVIYKYNPETNSYDRSYENGTAHEVYSCPSEALGKVSPEGACILKQLSPSVVAIMMVSEKKADDGYHENITTLGSGNAYVFQNGRAIAGTWHKTTVRDQIKFYSMDGAEIQMAPGQTFVEAVPNYGSVAY